MPHLGRGERRHVKADDVGDCERGEFAADAGGEGVRGGGGKCRHLAGGEHCHGGGAKAGDVGGCEGGELAGGERFLSGGAKRPTWAAESAATPATLRPTTLVAVSAASSPVAPEESASTAAEESAATWAEESTPMAVEPRPVTLVAVRAESWLVVSAS